MNSEQLLKATSRAFFLSLQVLPKGARQTMSLGYLLARCADSVSDGAWLPDSEREPALQEFLSCLHQGQASQSWRDRVAVVDPSQGGEAALLHHLPTALEELTRLPEADRKLVSGIVTTLVDGMLTDLRRFPGSVETPEELRRHLWAAAGCVGDFWTAVIRLHEPALASADGRLEELGTRLGNALQLTNVLRDIPGDLRDGRCYLPRTELEQIGLTPADLNEPENHEQLRPLMVRWLQANLDDYRASQDYVLRLPGRCWRLRLAALWPWVLGLKTIQKLASSSWLAPQKVKVARSEVYRMLAVTALLAPWTPALRRYMNWTFARAQKAVKSQEIRSPKVSN